MNSKSFANSSNSTFSNPFDVNLVGNAVIERGKNATVSVSPLIWHGLNMFRKCLMSVILLEYMLSSCIHMADSLSYILYEDPTTTGQY
jgi:hypothetical protein